MFKDTDDIEDQVTRALDTYSFLEILEHNDLTEEEVLVILVENGFLKLPEVLSV